MRNPKRIRRICNALAGAWEANPDLRFWQLLECIRAYGKAFSNDDMFYVEDPTTERMIEDFINEHGNV